MSWHSERENRIIFSKSFVCCFCWNQNSLVFFLFDYANVRFVGPIRHFWIVIYSDRRRRISRRMMRHDEEVNTNDNVDEKIAIHNDTKRDTDFSEKSSSSLIEHTNLTRCRHRSIKPKSEKKIKSRKNFCVFIVFDGIPADYSAIAMKFHRRWQHSMVFRWRTFTVARIHLCGTSSVVENVTKTSKSRWMKCLSIQWTFQLAPTTAVTRMSCITVHSRCEDLALMKRFSGGKKK